MDTGSVWTSLSIEGCARGFVVVHGLAGFEYEKAYEVLNIPKDTTHQVCAMFCVGKKSPETNNQNVTQRNPVQTFTYEGVFINREK